MYIDWKSKTATDVAVAILMMSFFSINTWCWNNVEVLDCSRMSSRTRWLNAKRLPGCALSCSCTRTWRTRCRDVCGAPCYGCRTTATIIIYIFTYDDDALRLCQQIHIMLLYWRYVLWFAEVLHLAGFVWRVLYGLGVNRRDCGVFDVISLHDVILCVWLESSFMQAHVLCNCFCMNIVWYYMLDTLDTRKLIGGCKFKMWCECYLCIMIWKH